MPQPWTDAALLADLALARGGIDRRAERRSDEEWLAQVWADERTRVLPVHDGMIAVDTSLARLRPIRTSDVTADAERLLLGTDSTGTTWFAARMPVEGPRAGLREVGAELSGDEVALATTAIALDNWHGAHARCSRCGVITVPAQAGWIRRCPEDGSEHYPRTDPAVIVLVLDEDDRALLGRQGRWQPSWFSTLAGFVEPGESLEDAVVREVLEETGVAVQGSRYHSSQPWPFPSSLMLGFTATAAPGAPVIPSTELEEARWFTRESIAAGEVMLPPATSISHRLIAEWFDAAWPKTLGEVTAGRPWGWRKR